MKLKLSTLFLGAAAMLSSCGAPQDVKSEKVRCVHRPIRW